MSSAFTQHLFKGTAELLLSGEFSDFTFYCRDKSFKVHRAIICPQSQYFQKLCGGGFKEVSTGRAEIKEEDPYILALLLIYCYTGRYSLRHSGREVGESTWWKILKNFDVIDKTDNRSDFDKDHLTFSTDARMYVAGDKYMLPDLQDVAMEEYGTYLAPGESIDLNVVEDEDFLESVGVIYDASVSRGPGEPTMKDFALRYTWDKPGLCNNEEAFKRVVKKHPDFAWALAEQGRTREEGQKQSALGKRRRSSGDK